MISLVIALHIVVSISLCVVVLVQQGKGADVGAVFGGSSTTLFGSSGAGNMLTKTTYALATVFFATSIYLAYASSHRVTGSLFSGRSLPPAAEVQHKSSKAAPAKGASSSLPNSVAGAKSGGVAIPGSSAAPKAPK